MEPKRTYYENGQLKSEAWWEGKFHRLDGPAFQYWYENGQLMKEGWCVEDKLHRVDGPAYRSWYDNGKLLIKEWWIEDEPVTPIQDPLEWALFVVKNFGDVPGLEKFISDNIEEKAARVVLASARLM